RRAREHDVEGDPHEPCPCRLAARRAAPGRMGLRTAGAACGLERPGGHSCREPDLRPAHVQCRGPSDRRAGPPPPLPLRSSARGDVTDHLTAGAGTLLVSVDNAANETVYPQQADFTFYGGIYREVRRISVDPTHITLAEHGGPGITVIPALQGEMAQVALSAR